jgi:hypothetical protein
MSPLRTVKRAIRPFIPDPVFETYWTWREQARHRAAFRRDVRPTDVFVVGHPKSGNTWLTYMLALLLERRFEGARATLANVETFAPAIHGRDGEIARPSARPDPRLFRNEEPLYPELYPRTIYMLRDPRAVVLSYYHHWLHWLRYHRDLYPPHVDTSLDAYLDELLGKGCITLYEPDLERWDRQVLAWLGRAKYQPVLVVRYEEMISDRRRVLLSAVRFIGLTCDDDDIERAVELGSFENMRKSEEQHGAEPYLVDVTHESQRAPTYGATGERDYFMRRGRVDSWRDEMNARQLARIEHEFARAMAAAGYLPAVT